MEHDEVRHSREESAIVLDFLPNGYPSDRRPAHRKSPIAHLLGKSHFTLLEVDTKPEVFLQPYEEVYIGEGKRDKVNHILGRLSPERLTATGSNELEYAITDIVTKNEARFVEFFNKAQPMSVRTHQLELLPGLGKKHMWEIIETRETKAFASFDDMKARVRLLPDPKKLIVRRIVNEVNGKEKHRLFTDA